jgi:hypothetical protein
MIIVAHWAHGLLTRKPAGRAPSVLLIAEARMKAILIAAAAALALGATAYARERSKPLEYTILRENVSITLTNSVDRDFGVGRDGSIVFRERQRWYRAVLLPPCSHEAFTEFRIGFVHRGPWLDRGSQVLLGDHVCQIRRLDEIADPRPARGQAEPSAAEPSAAEPAAEEAKE